jgi:hypothetical protein
MITPKDIDNETQADFEATDEEAEQVKGVAARMSKTLKGTKSSKMEPFRQG